jgi:hypothetical protein
MRRQRFTEDLDKIIDGGQLHPNLTGLEFFFDSRHLNDIIAGLELGDRPDLARDLTAIDLAEKDRPRLLKAAHRHTESLSRFAWASLELFGSPAYGKYLRTRDDTSDIYTYSLQTTCFDDLLLDDRFDDFFLDDRLVYKAHIKPRKPKKKGNRHGRAHGRPPEPDLSELCISDDDTSATSSRVLKGSEPETTNVDTDRIPFLPSICSSPVLEFGFLKSAIATDPAELLCPPPFTPIKPPRDGAHETRVPDA